LLQADAETPIDELQAIEFRSLQGAAQQLARWQQWLAAQPPHDALQSIYDDGDVLARFAAASPQTQRDAVLANLRALLSVSLQVDGGRYSTPYTLVRALKAGGIQAPATVSLEAVRLLTIHGAKGLEAEAVLMLDTDTPPRNADSMGVLVDWPGEAAVPERFAFVVSETRPPACCVKTLEVEQAARHREELNALYVALTRARTTVAMSSIEPYREAPNSWWLRLSELATQWPEPRFNASAAPTSEPSDATNFDLLALPSMPSLPNVPTLPTLPLAPQLSPALTQTDGDSTASRTGQAMHRLLEWGALSERHVRAVTREFKLDLAQAQTALAGAQRILSGEGAWAWDPTIVSWQGNEVELAYAGQSLRLDRLVQRQDQGHAGEWWVLDYKSNASPQHLPELRMQMQTYRDAVQAVYAGQTVKTAFLTAQGQFIEVS
jgi:ATP-dependent helicase/nuclease subunit A